MIGLPELTIGNVETSIAGCRTLVIDGAGFDDYLLNKNEVTVCGYPCKILDVTTFN